MSYSYLRLYRNRCALSQDELAQMVGIARSVLSEVEQNNHAPPLEVALGLEVVFGVPPSAFFAGLYAQVESSVMAQAAHLDKEVQGKTDIKSQVKRELLAAMMNRVRGSSAGV